MSVAPLAAAAVHLPAAAPAPAPSGGFGAALRAAAAGQPAAAAGRASPVGAALHGIERAQERLDAVLAAARRGQTFTAGELLALQADAHRYAETVDLASRVVEGVAQSVRQAANTQL